MVKRNRLTVEDIQRKLSKRNNSFEYIGGYTDADGIVVVVCKDCGNEHSFSAQVLRPYYQDKKLKCPSCEGATLEHYERRKAEELKATTDEWEYVCCNDRASGSHVIKCKKCGHTKTIKSFSTLPCCAECKRIEKRKEKENKEPTWKECAECGTIFETERNTQKYCCKQCRKKSERKRDTEKRRVRNATNKRLREAKARHNGKVDYSITLTKLIERDKGICKLCGRPVDEEDYIYVGDTFIAGNNYPSIDHIKPLSKGGVHQWSNVQLAHRICNSIKCDK